MDSPLSEKLLLELENAGWGKDRTDYCPISLGCCVPDLSELIEACGLENFGLVCNSALIEDYRWEAHDHAALELADNWTHGSTPEEAVARLWLALNTNGN